MNYPLWFSYEENNFYLLIAVKTAAKKNAIFRDETERLQIFLQAVPHENAANESLIYFLSKLVKVPQKDISIIRGHRSRFKKIKIKSFDTPDNFLRKLHESN